MTKEEYLNKHDTSRKYIEQTCRPELFAAMDEYAKQQVMYFIKWVQQHHRSTDTPDTWLILGQTGWLTDDQLYSQFIDNQFIEQQNKP